MPSDCITQFVQRICQNFEHHRRITFRKTDNKFMPVSLCSSWNPSSSVSPELFIPISIGDVMNA